MLGYWGDAAATAQRIDADGWLDTKDLVEVDEPSGQLRILGRADDVIVLASGRKIHPSLIEREAEQIDGVGRAMLVDHNGQLELWVDGEQDIDLNELESIGAAKPPWQRPARVVRFQPPLTIASGELTSKGTLRRGRIRETRFGTKLDNATFE
jgi:acyl-CoA synthetase (AMP-forming)/AMP-acid ligase II